MRRTVAAITALTLASAPAFAAPTVDPTAAPGTEVLLAQAGIDALDSDLKDEESLEFLQDLEFDKEAWSMGTAVGLSLLPGAGWGLMYAEKPAQSTVPFLLSAVGYGIGAMYLGGFFDETSVAICSHVRDGRVGYDECGYADVTFDPTNPDQIDNNDIDPRDTQMRAYFATRSDYEYGTRGEDFDGQTTGLIILGSTYVVTTLIGAAWAGSTVYEHNEQLRKDIESTAGRDAVARKATEPAATPPRPFVGYDGQRGVFGVALDF